MDSCSYFHPAGAHSVSNTLQVPVPFQPPFIQFSFSGIRVPFLKFCDHHCFHLFFSSECGTISLFGDWAGIGKLSEKSTFTREKQWRLLKFSQLFSTFSNLFLIYLAFWDRHSFYIVLKIWMYICTKINSQVKNNTNILEKNWGEICQILR